MKRQRVIDLMVERARAADESRYLLFIDEAQWVPDVHLIFLMDLHNQLRLAGDVRLITILIGQPELLDRRRDLQTERKSHLLNRFMTSTYQYDGVKTLGNFGRLCEAFDARAPSDEPTSTAFTEDFLPQAYGAGWRLQDQAERIWGVVCAARRDAGLSTDGELPMQALIAMLRSLLQGLHDRDQAGLVLETNEIERVYYASAHQQVLNHLPRPPKPGR